MGEIIGFVIRYFVSIKNLLKLLLLVSHLNFNLARKHIQNERAI